MDGGAIERSDDDDDDDEADADPNVVRARKPKHKREQLHFDTTAALKSKWAQGDIEKAAAEKVRFFARCSPEFQADRSAELEQLRSVKLSERFKERTGDEVADVPAEPLTNDHVDTTSEFDATRATPFAVRSTEHPKQAFLRFLRYRRFLTTDMPVNCECRPTSAVLQHRRTVE